MTLADAARAVCAALNERRASGGRLFAGIDGAGGAGKSTLADAVRDAMRGDASIIRCDDFYRPLIDTKYASLTPEQAYENYFDWQRLRDGALMPLRSGKPARYQRYDWSLDQLAEWIETEPREIVLVEGVYATRPELRRLLDLAIFVETPRAERMRRMRARGQDSDSWIARWMVAEDWYLKNIDPASTADLVLDGF